MYDLRMVPSIVDLIMMYWNNDGAIVKAKGTMVSSKIKTSTWGDTISFEKSLVIMMLR